MRLNMALAAALVLAAATAVAQAGRDVWALHDNLDGLVQIERELKQQVIDVRKKLAVQDSLQGRITSLKIRKAEKVTTLQVWEEVTQILPESAWISEMRIDETTLHLDGFAQAASELIGIFAKSNLFAKVEFGQPVTRDSKQGLERFQVRMKIERRSQTRQATVGTREEAP